MSRPSPAAALNGVETGNICDRCNRGIRTGDMAVVYATHYDADGCPKCDYDELPG